MSDSPSQQHLEVFLRERARRKKGKRQWQIGVAATGLLLWIGLSWFMQGIVPLETLSTLLLLLIVLPAGLVVLLYEKPGRLEQAAFNTLLAQNDKAAIGPLLEQWAAIDPTQRDPLQQALTRLLLQIEPEDAALLSSTQRQKLYHLLDYITREHRIELRLAVIAALRVIGERGCLKPLYQLASGEAATKGAQAVRAAAQKCLYDLQARLDFGELSDLPAYLKRIYSTEHNTTYPFLIEADTLYALLSLVPRITSANYRQVLAQEDRERLYRLLKIEMIENYTFDRLKLFREIVQMLARVGDTKAVPAIRPVAYMDAPTDGERQLRTAAREALRVLNSLLEKEKVGQSLLRASAAPGVQPDELLRPAGPTVSTTAPQELLRAASTQPEQTQPQRPQALRKSVPADPLAEMRKMVLSLPPEDSEPR